MMELAAAGCFYSLLCLDLNMSAPAS